MDDLLETDESVEENNTNTSEENQSRCGGQWGDFCKHCIYGSLDGVLTTFAIVSAGAGGSLSRQAIFVLGVSNIAADSLNMGLGDALSAISHHEYVLERYSDQKARLSSKKKRRADIDSLIEIYERKGLSRRHASAIVRKMSKYDSIFVQSLVQIPEPIDPTTPWKDGLITFMSFGVIGFFPIFVRGVRAPISFLIHSLRALTRKTLTNSHRCHFLVSFLCNNNTTRMVRNTELALRARTQVHCILPSILYPDSSPEAVLRSTCISTLSLLFALGVATSFFSGKSPIRCGLEFLLMGSAVFVVSFFVAHHVRESISSK